MVIYRLSKRQSLMEQVSMRWNRQTGGAAVDLQHYGVDAW